MSLRLKREKRRISRIYRLGQDHPSDVYNLVSEPGIESRISDLVGTKRPARGAKRLDRSCWVRHHVGTGVVT